MHLRFFFPPCRFLLLAGLLTASPAALAAANYSASTTTANWIDPSTHTLVTWSAGAGCSGGSYNGFSPDDDITAQIPLGFTFTYGSTDYTSVQIMSNGRVQFGNGWCDFGTPYYQVPDVELDNTLYALSMDLNPSVFDNSAGGGNSTTTCDPNDATQPCGVYYASLGSAPNRYFVITWRNVPEYGDQRRFFNVQAIIYEDGHFELQYGPNGRDPLNGTPGVGWQLDSSVYYPYNYADVDDLTDVKLVFTPTDLAALVISAPAFGDECSLTPIGITALDSNGDIYTGYTGTLELAAYDDLTNWNNNDLNGTWFNGDGAGVFSSNGNDSGLATYQFVLADGGTVTMNYDNDSDRDTVIVVTDIGTGIQAVYNPLVYAQRPYQITQAAGIVPANTVVAGRPHDFTVIAFRNCAQDSGYDGNKNIAAWITRDAADPGGPAPSIGSSGPLPGSNPNFNNPANLVLTFNNGVATAALTLATTDVGKYSLSLKDVDENNNRYLGSTATLTVRPFGYAFVAPAFNAATTGAIAAMAGAPFSLTVSGMLWEAADDADNDGVPDGHADVNPANDADLSNNSITASFAWDTTLQAVLPFAPSSGTLGIIGIGALSNTAFTGGSQTIANQTYSEVGGVTIQAAGTDYLGSSGVNIASLSPIIGRFTPAYLDVVITRQGCFTPGFTYSGQPVDEVQLTARNTVGATTLNYGPAYSKAITFSDGGATGSGAFSNNTVAAGSFTSGTLTLADQPTFTFTNPETLPTAVPLRATDSDAVNSTGHEQSIALRSGRVRLLSAGGSELLPLPMAFRVETWRDFSGTPAWQIESGDTCTTLTTGAVSFSNLNPGALAISATALALSAGVGTITLTGDQPGSADVTLAVPVWLQFDWNNDATTEDPAARAAFGVYKGNEAQIYIRE